MNDWQSKPWYRRQKRSHSALARDLLFKYLLTLAVWAVAMAAGAVGCYGLFSSLPWDGNGLLYQILTVLKEYILAVYIVAVLAGWIFLSYYFLSKPLRYLDELIAAAKQLAAPDSAPIRLPPAMYQAETQLNLVREQALRSTLAARDAEQRKNDLLVYLAHDLKTPLTSVIGYLTLLRDEPQISEELRARYTRTALQKADRLEELINEFFEITRFNLAHIELERAPVDLTRMLEQLASEFLPMLRDKELTCETTLPPRLEYVCDPDQLARVFDNLLRNAVYYSFPHSVIHIALTESRETVTVSFRNVGPTIPKDKLKRIFEQFFRLDSSRSTNTGGAGLGLAIAKQLVELHGGTISAESADSRTVFTIVLPHSP